MLTRVTDADEKKTAAVIGGNAGACPARVDLLGDEGLRKMKGKRTKAVRQRSTTGARADGGLTQRQEVFCLAFVETGNASEAYRRAYDARRMSQKTVHECASRLLADRKVAARVAELRGKAADKAVLTLVDHLAKLAELRDLAMKDSEWDAATRAEVKRGEAAGLYPDRGKSVSVNVGLPGKSEPVSETAQWINELTGRDVGSADRAA